MYTIICIVVIGVLHGVAVNGVMILVNLNHIWNMHEYIHNELKIDKP